MVELNWLLFFFIFLYVGQSAFSIWLDRINLIHAGNMRTWRRPGSKALSMIQS